MTAGARSFESLSWLRCPTRSHSRGLLVRASRSNHHLHHEYRHGSSARAAAGMLAFLSARARPHSRAALV